MSKNLQKKQIHVQPKRIRFSLSRSPETTKRALECPLAVGNKTIRWVYCFTLSSIMHVRFKHCANHAKFVIQNVLLVFIIIGTNQICVIRATTNIIKKHLVKHREKSKTVYLLPTINEYLLMQTILVGRRRTSQKNLQQQIRVGTFAQTHVQINKKIIKNSPNSSSLYSSAPNTRHRSINCDHISAHLYQQQSSSFRFVAGHSIPTIFTH